MKRTYMLLILFASLVCVSPTFAQVDTDGDGLLDLMDVPGFNPNASEVYYVRKRIQDLDGAGQLTNAIWLDLYGNQIRSLESMHPVV